MASLPSCISQPVLAGTRTGKLVKSDACAFSFYRTSQKSSQSKTFFRINENVQIQTCQSICRAVSQRCRVSFRTVFVNAVNNDIYNIY
jgi:hypothetical protein